MADNLASNEARARIDALHGKYSQTTDQFYEQEYRNLLFQGLSPREAEELAGKNALQYQAEKVSYLSDMLEGYGLNGGYMNDFGTRLVGMLGDTKGALGDYYAQMYRSPGAAQERANTVEDAVRGHQFGQENSLFTTYLNNAFADADLPRALQKIFATGDVNLRNALATGQQSEDFRIAGEGRAEGRTIAAERRAQAYEQQRLAQLDQWADSVFEGEDAKIAKAAIRAIKLPQKKGETISDDSLKNLKTLHDMLSKRAQALRELLAKGDQWNPGVDKATGDYRQDAPVLKTLWETANGNEETFKELVRNWLTASGMSGVSVTTYMGGLLQERIRRSSTRNKIKRRFWLDAAQRQRLTTPQNA